MSAMARELQIRMLRDYVQSLGVDADQIDIESEMDPTLTYPENRQHLGEIVHRIKPEVQISEVPNDMDKYEDQKAQIIHEMIQTGKLSELYNLEKWKDCIPHPSTVLILGKRGSGKSGLGYWLLEYLGKEYGKPAFVFGLPKDKTHLLPESIKSVETIEELPDNAIILFDEGHLSFHARLHNMDVNILMDMLITVSRQKSQTLIFITQESRKIDVNVVASVDCVCLKEPAPFTMEFERPQLRRVTERALEQFTKLDKDDRKKNAYVFSPEHVGLLLNPLSSFWTNELSTAFAGIKIADWNQTAIQEDLNPKIERDKDGLVIDRRERKKFAWECPDNACPFTQEPRYNPCYYCPKNKRSGWHNGDKDKAGTQIYS